MMREEAARLDASVTDSARLIDVSQAVVPTAEARHDSSAPSYSRILSHDPQRFVIKVMIDEI
jgi:hypothetical protein